MPVLKKKSSAPSPAAASKPAELAISRISSRGQVVIPACFRKKLRLEEGVTVVFREVDGHLVLEPDRFAAFFALQGSLDLLPVDLEGELTEERRREREREDRKS